MASHNRSHPQLPIAHAPTVTAAAATAYRNETLAFSMDQLLLGLNFYPRAAPRDRHREDAVGADQHVELLESGRPHQRVHFSLVARAHHPALSLTVVEHTRDHLELWMPGLIGIDQVSAAVERIRQPEERRA